MHELPLLFKYGCINVVITGSWVSPSRGPEISFKWSVNFLSLLEWSLVPKKKYIWPKKAIPRQKYDSLYFLSISVQFPTFAHFLDFMTFFDGRSESESHHYDHIILGHGDCHTLWYWTINYIFSLLQCPQAFKLCLNFQLLPQGIKKSNFSIFSKKI
jgi:hypothetical protein